MTAAGIACAETFDARVLASYGRNHVVGDIATAGEGQAVIEERLPRASLLYRADAWRSTELAANVDLVAVVCAARPAFNLYFPVSYTHLTLPTTESV